MNITMANEQKRALMEGVPIIALGKLIEQQHAQGHQLQLTGEEQQQDKRKQPTAKIMPCSYQQLRRYIYIDQDKKKLYNILYEQLQFAQTAIVQVQHFLRYTHTSYRFRRHFYACILSTILCCMHALEHVFVRIRLLIRVEPGAG